MHALALAGGKGRACSVEGQIAQAELEQASSRAFERLANRFRHGAHLIGKACGHARYPRHRFIERHFRRLRQIDAANDWLARGRGQARAAAVGAGAFRQVFRHAAQALLVFRLGEGVFHGAHGIVVGEVEFGEVLALLRLVEDVLLLGRPVEDDVALGGCELAKRHVRAHAHSAAHLLHEVPHERAPYHHGALVDGLAFVGHERGAVHGARDAGSAAGGAGSFAVERERFGARAEEFAAAMRAWDGQFGGNIKAWRHVLAAVWAYVAADAREQKAQAIQKLARSAERGTHAWYRWALVQRERRGHVANVVDRGLAGLRDAASRVGRKRFEVAA